MKQHGYATACIGKWHLGWRWPTKDGQPPTSGPDRLSNVDFTRPIADGPTTRGFDSYFGIDLPNYPPYCFIEDDRTVGIPTEPNRPEFNRPGPMVPGWQWVDIMPELTRRAVRYDRGRGRRDPAQAVLPVLPADRAALPGRARPRVPGQERRRATTATSWSRSTATVGQVLDALRRTGLADDTLVVFTSDNGPEITGEVKPGAYDRAEQYRPLQHGRAPRRQARRVGGGPPRPVPGALAGQDPRRARSATRRSRTST